MTTPKIASLLLPRKQGQGQLCGDKNWGWYLVAGILVPTLLLPYYYHASSCSDCCRSERSLWKLKMETQLPRLTGWALERDRSIFQNWLLSIIDSLCERLSQNPPLLSKPCHTSRIRGPGRRPERVRVGGMGLSRGFYHHCEGCPRPEEGPKSQVMCKSTHIHHCMRTGPVFYWLRCNNIRMEVLSCQCGGGGKFWYWLCIWRAELRGNHSWEGEQEGCDEYQQ